MSEAASWHYRIVRHRDGNLTLCEVYYDDEGKVSQIVSNPLFAAFAPAGEGKEHIVGAMRNALRDAKRFEVLDE